MTSGEHEIRKALPAVLPVDRSTLSISRIEDQVAAQGVSVSRRTLQRHLAAPEAEGVVVREGRSGSVSYRLAAPDLPLGEAGIALSGAGREVLDLVSMPVIVKRPVTYNQGFLDGYAPNETFYLPESLRTQLHDMGRTGAADRPAGTHTCVTLLAD